MFSASECSFLFCDGKTVRAEIGSKVYVASLNEVTGKGFSEVVQALWLQLLADGTVLHHPAQR